jgi:hypothetical protein
MKDDDGAIDRATRIVGMMGPEPFMRALDEGAQIVLAGRSSDPAPWAAYPAGYAFKATIPRKLPAGDVGDTDVYGARQHAPLLDVDIPI